MIELLVVIATISLFIGLMLPSVQQARESARRVECSNHLKQIALAAHNHHEVKGHFPPGMWYPIEMSGRYAQGTTLWVELFPYMEQANLQKKWDYDDNGNNIAGGINAAQAQVIKLLLCPSDPLPKPVTYLERTGSEAWATGYYGVSSYGGNAGTQSFPSGKDPSARSYHRDGIFFMNSSVGTADVLDGTSNTLFFGERYHRDPEYDNRATAVWPELPATFAQWGMWGYIASPGGLGMVTLSSRVRINYRVPPGGNRDQVIDRVNAFGSGHSGGANFASADGSVCFMSDKIDLGVFQALSTRAGGEVVERF